MNRVELINAIRESAEFKKTYKRGFVKVKTIPFPTIDEKIPPQTFNLWATKDHFDCIWGFCGKLDDEEPKFNEYVLITGPQLENWLNLLEFV